MKPPSGDDASEILFEEYQRRFTSKFWLGLAGLLILVCVIFVFKWAVLDPSMTDVVLKSSIGLFDIDSQWVVKDRVDTPDFKGVILVPEVSFRIRNVGRRDLHYVQLLGVFRFLDNGRTIGEGYQMILRRRLDPGQESKTVVLRCGFGYRASSDDAFERNRQNWRNAFVEVYAQSQNSKLAYLKTFYVSRRIAGHDVEVKIK